LEKKGLILVVIILFGLSLGPVIRFIGGGEEIELPDENGEEPVDQQVFESVFESEISSLDPYVYFEAVGEDNDVTAMRERIEAAVSEDINYSITSPNPTRGGWDYSGVVEVQNSSQAGEVGFKLWFHLSRHYQDVSTYREGEVTLPSNITGTTEDDEEITIHTGNQSISTQTMYSQHLNQSIEIDCPQMIADLDNQLTHAPARCRQDRDFPRYGVTDEHFEEKGRTIKKNHTLEIISTQQYAAQYSYQDQNLSEEQKENIKNLSAMQVDIDNETKTISVMAMDESNFNETIDYMRDKEFLELNVEKTVEVDMPDQVTLEGEEYTIVDPELDTGFTTVPFEHTEEEVPMEVSYKILYDEIFDLTSE